MKKNINKFAFLIAASGFGLSSAFATITAYEGFDYTPGPLSGGFDAPAPLGAWGTGQGGSVEATGLSYGFLPVTGGRFQSGGGGRPEISTGAADSGGVQYISWLASNSYDPTLLLSIPNQGYSVLEFKIAGDNAFAVGGSNNGNAGGFFTLDNQQDGGSGAGFNNSTVLRNLDVNLFVVKVDFSASGPESDVVSWWLNPALGGAEIATTIPTSTGDFNFTHIALARFGGPNALNVDEIRFGPTWESVTTAIPEPSSYALIFGGVVAGLAVTRRRRQAA